MKFNKLVLFVLAVTVVFVVIGCAPKSNGPAKVELPAGKAYAEGKEIFFVHTEVSDPDIAKLLSDMMTSPVLYVPALAKVSDEALANVYVFENGLAGTTGRPAGDAWPTRPVRTIVRPSGCAA